MENDYEIDTTSLKEIWKRHKNAKNSKLGSYFYGIRSPTTNEELYTLAASLKSKPPEKLDESRSLLEKYYTQQQEREFYIGDPNSPLYKPLYEQVSSKKTDKIKRSFFWLPEIKTFKKEKCNRTLEYDLKTSDPPTFIDMYGTISENDKAPHSLNPVESPIENMYQKKDQLSLAPKLSKDVCTSSKTDFSLSKLLDCFSKQPKILETRGTQTSAHSTPVTKTHCMHSSYTQTSSSINSSVSSKIFMDAKENFSSSAERIDSYKLQKEKNEKLQNMKNSSNYFSGIHCLCQKISLRHSILHQNTSPCNLYTIKNIENHNFQKHCYESKHMNHTFKKKIQISPTNILSSQSTICPFISFMKTKSQPMDMSQEEDTSPDFIVKKKTTSPFSYQTKGNYSTLQYCKPIISPKNFTNNDRCIKKKQTLDESLKVQTKNINNQNEKIFKDKKTEILRNNNNIVNYKTSLDNTFGAFKLENGNNSISSSFSTMNSSDISTLRQVKAISKNSVELVSKDENTLRKISDINKNIVPTNILIDNMKNNNCIKTNCEKKGKIRIPSIFLNDSTKISPISQSVSKILELNKSSQNIKINTKKNHLKTNNLSENLNKKENSKFQDFIVTDTKKNSNKISEMKTKEIDLYSFRTYTKERDQKNSKNPINNSSKHNPTTVEDITNTQKDKFSPQISKKNTISQLHKKLNNYSSITPKTSTINPKIHLKVDLNPKESQESSFNTKCKVIIPPIFLLQENNNNEFKKSFSLHTSSNSTLNDAYINEKESLYNRKSDNSIEKLKLNNFDRSIKLGSSINSKQSYPENTTFSQTKQTSKDIQKKNNCSFHSIPLDFKSEHKNNSINFSSSNFKKTQTSSQTNPPNNFLTINTKKKDISENMSRHKDLVSAYQEAVNISTMPRKITKSDISNRTQPNKIIIPSVFTMS